MPRTYAKSTETSFGFDTGIPPVVEIVARVARRLWPVKTARNLAMRTGKNHRSAEDWLALRTGMSADALAELLRSDVGWDVLDAIMEGSGASWWPKARRDLKAAQIERRIDALKEELRRELD
ncbi:hypothetical protein [Chelatococcus composti]|uniref:Uncharacterized protein n=1 Tax=Chelatococcus composti TaxID=1743235 RepID=A0A841KD06_9HYPH|nr:hypothetical protein [Chelatococcus composti]MBB6167149.1 hypothetical protein [Chelatococcus composti]